MSVLSDSRCPTDVACIRAGEVTVEVLAARSDGSETRLNLSLGDTGSPTDDFDGLRLTLQSVEPAPVSDRQIEAGDYVIRLLAERL